MKDAWDGFPESQSSPSGHMRVNRGMGSNIRLTWKLGRNSRMREHCGSKQKRCMAEGSRSPASVAWPTAGNAGLSGTGSPGRDNTFFIPLTPCLALEF